MTSLTLRLLSGLYAVCRLPADALVPPWAAAGEFQSMTRTVDELSIVCAADAVPSEIRAEAGWRCLCVSGVLDFALVGVLASLVAPLATAGVSVFVVSTFNTDYVLVREAVLGAAVAALRQAGHRVE